MTVRGGQDRYMASTMSERFSPRPDDGRRETEGDVLRSLVDGLIAEDLFGFRSRGRIGSVAGALYLPLSGDERHVQVGLGAEAVVFRARPAAALQPYRLSRPPVLLLGPDGAGPVPLTPRELLDARRRPAWPRRHRPTSTRSLDGLDLAVTHGAVLLEAQTVVGSGRAAAAARRCSTGRRSPPSGDRPFHPTGRARVGWDQARYRRYSPAGPQPFGLDWVAVRRDHLAWGASTEWPSLAWLGPPGGGRAGRAMLDRPPSPADACCRGRRAAGAAIAAAGVDGPDHVVLPVHPWQHAHVLAELFAPEWRSGVCVPVAKGLGAFRPTASTRTLVPAGGGAPAGAGAREAAGRASPRSGRCGCCRPATWPTPPGPSGCWRRPPTGTRRCRAARTPATSRPGGPSPPPGGRAGYDDKPGHLGCLLRVWPDEVGLGARPEPRAARRPRRSCCPDGVGARSRPSRSPTGATTPPRRTAALAVFDDVARVVSEVALACFGLGFMPELHGQNAVLVCDAGRVAGIVLRDHDTVRLHRPWLAAAGLADPGYDVKPGTPNSLWAAGPEELLGWFQTLGLEVSLQAIGRALDQRLRRRRGHGVAPPRRRRAGRPGRRRSPAGGGRGDRTAAVPRRQLADQARARPAAGPGRHRRRQHAERHRPGREPVPGRRRPGGRAGRARRRPSGS